MNTYVLWYRNKKGEIKAFPHLFFSAEHALNTGEEHMDKEGWIDYNYSVVTPPQLKEDQQAAIKEHRARRKRETPAPSIA